MTVINNQRSNSSWTIIIVVVRGWRIYYLTRLYMSVECLYVCTIKRAWFIYRGLSRCRDHVSGIEIYLCWPVLFFCVILNCGMPKWLYRMIMEAKQERNCGKMRSKVSPSRFVQGKNKVSGIIKEPGKKAIWSSPLLLQGGSLYIMLCRVLIRLSRRRQGLWILIGAGLICPSDIYEGGYTQ